MLLLGDCLEQLKNLPADSVDSLVTDPPAGISFMGKDWDSDKGGRDGWISWMAEVMRECNRVLKPGAHALVWAIPRTSHWTATALEDAGFEIRDVITHLFGQGFPKSMAIDKAIDKMNGDVRPIVGAWKPTGTARPKVGAKGHSAARTSSADETYIAQKDVYLPITSAASAASAAWEGWGTALKPASEHWILARKPISEKTIAKNVEKCGCGGINIDASRVATEANPKNGVKNPGMRESESGFGGGMRTDYHGQGRFPANLVLSHTPHCDDESCDIECAVKALDEQSPYNKESRSKSPSGTSVNGNGNTHGAMKRIESVNHPGEGHASRFFYCAKISKSERNEGLEGMPLREGGIKNSSGRGYSEADPHKPVLTQNHHPTVKPQKLMRYLCRMITPPGGVVLDPFMGSGSTGIAAKKEGFKFIGIEREPDYFEISAARIEHVEVAEVG
jgi:DNA modification methylase